MQPHEQRVLDEKEELDVKIEKLDGFIRSQIFQNLTSAERSLLREQHYFMSNYSKILRARIALFPKES